MPNTPKSNLPYPASTGVPPNVPLHLQQLAEALDALVQDSGWIDVAFSAGYMSWPSEPVKIRRVGRVVQMIGLVRNTAGTTLPTAQTGMFSIPIGFRPAQTIFADVTGSSVSATPGRMTMTTGGTTSFASKGTSTSTYWSCHQTWITDQN
jgi:hypothetical protein